MYFKKSFAAFLAISLLALGTTTAFAHHGGGHGCQRARAAVSYQSCQYEDCQEAQLHTHGNDGCYYYGHYENDGHTHCAAATTPYVPYHCPRISN